MSAIATSVTRKRLDPKAFPRVAEYLASLPRGLLSYPECESKASMYREALANLPTPMTTDGLDPLLADYIENPVPVSAWIPEVVTVAIYLAILDAKFPTENSFLDWVSNFTDATFRAPMYRMLMSVASPKLLAQGGERRWRTFHTGSDYTIKIGETSSETTLDYPPYCFHPIALKATLRAIQSAYRASGAKKATVELVEWTPTKAVYRASFQAA